MSGMKVSGRSSIRIHSSESDGCENADPLADSSSRALVDRAVSRARRRLVPFLMLLYVTSFLDRANISFAKQALQTSVGISEATYALAAGIFFVGYSLCGFPSNLFLHKIGAKIWISFLMVGWGLVSMATMFVRGSTSFYLLRLLLGIMEAGFFPGAILYLTYWFPNAVRGRILGLFYLGVPLALIVGGPLSGLLLGMHPWGGLQNWQWMFLVEGAMAVLLGCWAFRYLDSRPLDATWLPPEEKQALMGALTGEERERRVAGPAKILPMLRDRRVMQFLLIYTLIQMSTYGAIFYLPTEISALLRRPAGLEVGLVSAIPWLCTLVATYLLPHAADKSHRHRQFAACDVAGFWLRQLRISDSRTAHGPDRAFRCRLRLHCRATAFLDIPHRLSGRPCGGGRHCPDWNGESRRVSGAQREGMGR